MVVHLRATGDVPILKQAKFKSAAYGELISIGGLGLSVNGKLNSTITEIFETKLSLDSSRLCFKFYDVEVPCILGVNFYDKDLLEFLEQLAETNGSSTMPPFILRVLNFRACRGKTKISLEQLDMQVSTPTSELDSDLWYLLQEITQTSVREVFFIEKLYLFISMEQVRILMEGNIVAIIGFGSVVQQCMEAANILKSCNIDVTVEDARFYKPLDAELIRRLAKDMRS